ncbi:MAG: hypothetical protein N4A68_00380 [Maledivibacter sp.]|jgi:hypothetical protein|nr:hypothetical protein [Maledivibacter sp.]
MKSINVKSLACGLLIGTIGTIGITGVFASGLIKSTKYEEVTVTLNDTVIPMKDSMVSIVKNGENDSKLYMPAEEILEYMGYNVEFDDTKQSINISTKSILSSESMMNKNISENQPDKLALEIMKKTGNWSYVEPLFSYMTPQGVKETVDLYINEKGGNQKQVQSALSYMNKDNTATNGSNQLKTQADYDRLATEVLGKTNDMFSVMFYMPYMSKDKIDAIVKDYVVKTNNFNCIYNVHQYMSIKGIDDTVKSYIDKTGDYGTVAAILQFMSPEASGYIAKKYINESKNQQYSKFFTPYLEK